MIFRLIVLDLMVNDTVFITFFHPHKSVCQLFKLKTYQPKAHSTKPNLALSYITSSTRMYSVRKLWIYFFFMKLETCSCIGWAASALNQIWGRYLSPEGNKIGPQLLRRLINESQVWVPVGDNLIGRRGGIVTNTHAAVCYMAPLAQTCQSRRGQVR